MTTDSPTDDDPLWTAEDFASARPASEVHPSQIIEQLVRKPGRPAKPVPDRRQAVSLRLPPRVVAHFKAAGPGWQTRISDALEREVDRVGGRR